MHRRIIVPLLVAAVALGACSKKPEPVQPTPRGMNQDSLEMARLAAEKARQDSIRAAEEARAKAAAAEADRAARASLAEMIHFDYDQFSIRTSAEEILLRKAAVLKANPDVQVTITGHADERGSVEYNLALGMRRAEAAKAFLVGYGIDGGRLEIASLGEQQPIDPAQTEDAFARNRRDEFSITAGSPLLKAPGSSN